MPFYPSWVVYIDQAAKSEATDPMHHTDAKWAIESIREMKDELDAARARVAELEADNEQLRQGVAQARRLLNAPAADTAADYDNDQEEQP